MFRPSIFFIHTVLDGRLFVVYVRCFSTVKRRACFSVYFPKNRNQSGRKPKWILSRRDRASHRSRDTVHSFGFKSCRIPRITEIIQRFFYYARQQRSTRVEYFVLRPTLFRSFVDCFKIQTAGIKTSGYETGRRNNPLTPRKRHRVLNVSEWSVKVVESSRVTRILRFDVEPPRKVELVARRTRFPFSKSKFELQTLMI